VTQAKQAVESEFDCEKLFALIDAAPPTLLPGIFEHIVRRLYDSGVSDPRRVPHKNGRRGASKCCSPYMLIERIRVRYVKKLDEQRSLASL
jgi:hypothetical protein